MNLLPAFRHALTSFLPWRSASRPFGVGVVIVLCAASLAGAQLADSASSLAFAFDTPTEGRVS